MAGANVFPQPFVVRQQPQLADNLNLYLKASLGDIATTLNGVLAMLPQAATAAPTTPHLGMVRLAQAPWRPVLNQTADAWVIYNGNGWDLLAGTAV